MQQSDDAEEGKSLKIYPPRTDLISEFWRDKYEKDAKKYWDIFYKRNADKFFKDRHYLDKEWGVYFQRFAASPSTEPQQMMPLGLSNQLKVVLEIGCGAGNTLFPLLATYPNMFIYACDFSPRAVNLVKTHKEYTDKHIHAFVCDITCDDLTSVIPVDSIDIAMLVFTLSAISPDKMPWVLQNIKNVLKPNGHILVRDYAVGDLAQERFSNKVQKISQNFYVRGDGTRAFYFTEVGLCDIFKNEGFSCETIKVHEKKVENRAQAIVMDRRWIQGVFCRVEASYPHGETTDGPRKSERYHDNSIDGLEVELSEGIAADMFGISDAEMIHIELNGYDFQLRCLSRENQHRCKDTGLMLWDSAQVLATLLAKNTSAIASKTVLELGCGSVGICSIVTAMVADLVVASDGDSQALALLADNVKSNRHLIPSGNLVTQTLQWGCMEHILQAKEKTSGRGFDMIFGTDITYVAEAVPLLFATATALIAEPTSGKPEPLVLICHIVRQVDEHFVIDVASQYGFSLEDKWSQDLSETERCKTIASLFCNGLAEILDICNVVRILCFRKIAKKGEN